ncbi:substrate-binding periplasmic protein [Undibacterium sp. SXout20W]|uniref:substrate-binding periplasmic protein n=1 Tax=Undibacterium sp. SXout20W TaxID=3413051 RepID=UPI003BF5BABB
MPQLALQITLILRYCCYFFIFSACSGLFSEAHAKCTRKIHVAFSPTGLTAIAKDNEISGVYPDLLSSMANKDGCLFNFSIVPRARQELMFQNGQTDLLLPAIRTSRRDAFGTFVPLLYTRAALISIQSDLPPVSSIQDLLDRKSAKVVVVRGYDYGDVYVNLMQELMKQERLIYEANPGSVARMLKAGAAEYTLMAPYILIGEVARDARVRDLEDKLHFEILSEIPWLDSGVYLSTKTLTEQDKQSLQVLFNSAAKSGFVWKFFQNYYQSEALNLGSRPR